MKRTTNNPEQNAERCPCLFYLGQKQKLKTSWNLGADLCFVLWVLLGISNPETVFEVDRHLTFWLNGFKKPVGVGQTGPSFRGGAGSGGWSEAGDAFVARSKITRL